MHEKILTHPVTQESMSITQWAKKIGIDTSTMSSRVKKYDDERLFYPRYISKVLWSKAEDELLKEVWMFPNCLELYKEEARKLKLPRRKDRNIKDRIFTLREQGEVLIKKGNLKLAIKTGILNETQLAKCLNIAPQTVQTFWKNYCLLYTICPQTHQHCIELKNFASWAISSKGSKALARAIRQDQQAVAWVLEIVGKWLWT
jgi:hypothetical protein